MKTVGSISKVDIKPLEAIRNKIIIMNQFKVSLLSIVSIILLCSCNTQEKKQERIEGLNLLLNYYFSVNYDYPATKNDFVYFCEHDTCLKGKLQDTLGIILNYFTKNKVCWYLDNSNFPDQKLIILSGKDTIVLRNNNWRLPCIGYYNDAFVDCYLREPSSIHEFLLFCNYCDSISEKYFWPYQKCDSITIMNLRKYSELTSLQWTHNSENLYLIINNDTLWHHNSTNPCTRTDKATTFVPHYYNQDHLFVAVSENIDKTFRSNLRDLSKQYCNEGNIMSNQFQIFEFDYFNGLRPYCEDDTARLNRNWFLALEQYLQVFADENRFERIVFSVPIVEK